MGRGDETFRAIIGAGNFGADGNKHQDALIITAAVYRSDGRRILVAPGHALTQF